MLQRLKSKAFQVGFVLTTRLARTPHHRLTRRWTRAMGLLTLFVQRGRRAEGIEAVANEWQRMFPDPNSLPIVEIEEKRFVAAIEIPCPLRGSGDLEACHRTMEYDRRMLEKIGGRLEVLESQATPGRSTCLVAISLEDGE